jgi:hypothetical protein
MMPKFAREGVVISDKLRFNAIDTFRSGCHEGLRIKLSDESLNREIFSSLEDAWPFAGGQLR